MLLDFVISASYAHSDLVEGDVGLRAEGSVVSLLQSQVAGTEAVWLSEFGGSVVSSLTRTEALALLALGQGLTRREIAAKLRLSPYTVSHYLTIGKEKLGAKTLVEAAVAVCLARTWASETSEAETSGGSGHQLDRLRRYNS